MLEFDNRIMLNRIVIIGTGLIGTSFALALKNARAVKTIVGIDRDLDRLNEAVSLGAIDVRGVLADINGADLVLLAVPVRKIAAILAEILPFLDDHTLLIDVGSTKQDVITAVRQNLMDRCRQFVPCHPIAGREQHGPLAADAGLFAGKKVVVTALPENPPATVSRAAEIWQTLGAVVVEMPAETHDAVFAAVSHLPHMLAFVLVEELASRPNARVLFEHAASGFRDFTRIASSSPEMWRDIALNNRSALLAELDAFLAKTMMLRNDLADANEAQLMGLMQRAKHARGQWLSGQFDQFHDDSA